MYCQNSLEITRVILMDMYEKRKLAEKRKSESKKKGRPKKEVIKEETTE
ncbi:MAG: hypothetical protein GOVbin4206_97 [Prokaryotic dsDNA virus sp.]|nr:MAG: hypothetical protein GOVbin4206_97 [Prokaryotic dsDNA virus sp.]